MKPKKTVPRILKEFFHSEDFKNRFCDGAELGSLLDQWLGSHSFRKCAPVLVVMVMVWVRLICKVVGSTRSIK